MNNLKMCLFAMLLFGLTSCQRPRPKEENPFGIVFECKKTSTREVPDVGEVPVMTFTAKNVPPGKWFELRYQNDLGMLVSRATFISDHNGRLLGIKGGQIAFALDTIQTAELELFPGLERTYWLVSKDETTAIKASDVPLPLEAFASNGARMSLSTISKYTPWVDLRGSKFSPNEKLKLYTQLENEYGEIELICSKAGKFTCIFTSDSFEKGVRKLSVAVERNTGEVLQIDFDRDATRHKHKAQ